jgi:hypothetical protein
MSWYPVWVGGMFLILFTHVHDLLCPALGLHARFFTSCFLSRENMRPENMVVVY